jgi:hypothetical protein
MAEKELNELVELLRELEETLVRLKTIKSLARRRLLVRKISRLFEEIERNPVLPKLSQQASAW